MFGIKSLSKRVEQHLKMINELQNQNTELLNKIKKLEHPAKYKVNTKYKDYIIIEVIPFHYFTGSNCNNYTFSWKYNVVNIKTNLSFTISEFDLEQLNKK